MREVAELLDRVLEVGADLVEHRLGLLGILVGELTREPHVHRERDEVLLCPVVEVALDLAPLGVAGLDDACARGAQLVGLAAHLVERLLERRVEGDVVQRETDLARELGERLVVVVAERRCAHRVAERRGARAADPSS